MKIEWRRVLKRSLVLVLAAACLFGAAPVLQAQAMELNPGPMTVRLADGQAEFQEDLDTAGIVVDLYLLAKAVNNDPEDSGYKFADPKVDLELEPDKIVEAAVEIAKEASPAVSGGKLGDTDTLSVDPGLYLMVLHGAEPASKAEYFTENEDGAPVTIANSAIYQYMFRPQLISIPTKYDEVGKPSNTADEGDWYGVANNPLNVELKVAREPRLADLVINKTLNGYIPPDAAAFVFHIEAVQDGETDPVFEDYEALYFTASGSQSVVVHDVPVGTMVTVTEEYTGATYYLVSGDSSKEMLPNDENGNPATSFSFVNDYDGTVPGGTGMTNHFEKTERWTGIRTQ